jgi:tetrapyrrole methylase family protein/MazG family protein
VPALSFLDLAWAALAIDPLAQGVRLVDAGALELAQLGRGPLLAAQCWSRHVLSDVKLSMEDTGSTLPRPVILHHLGLADERVTAVDWWELDRTIEPDHLTSLYIPAGAAPGQREPADAGPSFEVGRLVTLMETLRARCPWDGAQTHASLMPHLVEECYEVVDALAALDGLDEADGARPATVGVPDEAYAHLQEELGDLLFQIVFHARLADEEGRFDLGDVARGVHDKLVHRHPHVFADVAVDGAAQVARNWEDIKKAEKGRHSVTEGIPSALPALMLTTKLVRKARSVGLEPGAGTDGSAAGALAALEERAMGYDPHPDDPLSGEGDEPARQVGEILFAVVTLAQRVGVDAEQALRDRAMALRAAILEAEGVPDQGNRSR